MSEVENKIDCPLIEFNLSVTYSCLELFFTLFKIDLLCGLATFQQFYFHM